MTAGIASHSSAGNTAVKGVLVMLLAMLMFSLNDAMGKWLAGTYPATQMMAIRSLAALLFLSPLFIRRGWRNFVLVERPGLQALRSLLFAIDGTTFYFAVRYMPLADAMTFWMAAPIYVAAASPLLLGEHVGWRRWTAILIGFLGVVIALGPSGTSLSLPTLVALLGSAADAFALLLGRTLRKAPDTTLIFWQLSGAALLSLAISTFDHAKWAPMDGRALSCLALLGVVAMLAHLLVTRALKLADAATVIPFHYTMLFWAIVFSWFFFGEPPRLMVMIGAALIVASGLFIFLREQQLTRQPAATQ
jgi:drug/metabolite transporter (DMT)-like permease